jgi:Protein of unknown function (DUF3995)
VRLVARLTGGVLAALAALHVAWGLGSSFPFRTRRQLADAVVGASAVPSPSACFAVAGALTTGAALTSETVPLPPSFRRTAILGSRGALGLAGRTALLAPGSDSLRFVYLDRRIYAPLCLGLTVGSLVARVGVPSGGRRVTGGGWRAAGGGRRAAET